MDMKDFTLSDKALKLNWVKRLCSNSDAPWQYIPKMLLANVGGTELFKSNYDYNLLDLDNHLPTFYKQIIFYWQDIATTTPKIKNEVLSQPIWNNRFLTVHKRMVFFPHWYLAGIKTISDLFDSCERRFLPFSSFYNRFNVKCNFLQYCSILSSIPQNWKKLQEGSEDPVTPPTSISSLSCKAIYRILLNLEDLPLPTSEKKLLASGVEKSDLNKIYLIPFKATREIILTMFQYKIIHRILPTNSLLHKMKKVASPSCPFCPSECQILWHLFINCVHASSFWNRFQQWYSIASNTKLLLSELEVMFGIICSHTYCLALNHLIILGKYFLYVNALNTIRYGFDDFVSLVRDKIKLEKYIAVTCNKEKEFRNKWKYFLSL